MSERVTQERDRIPSRRIGLVALGVLVVAALGVVLSTALGIGARDHEPQPPRAAAPEIGIVEQSLIESTQRGVDLRETQEHRLQSYGFVDETHQTAKIPIDRAMRIVAGQP